MNMPYCRFQNTLRDLGDCFANLATLNPEDQSFNECEERECRRLVGVCLEQIEKELFRVEKIPRDEGRIGTFQ